MVAASNQADVAVGSTRANAIRVGAIGGLLGGGVIWVYELVVWIGIQHMMPLSGLPANAVGLVFGKPVQVAMGPLAMVLGTGIHFFFSAAWGVGFALIWHIWWLAVIGFAGLVGFAIFHTFNLNRDFHIPADEVARVEDAHTRALAATGA